MDEDVMNLRCAATLGVVQSIDDSGETQTAVVQLRDGDLRTVEIWQPDGFAAVPSGDGAIALVFPVGNDPSLLKALIANPSTRFGKQLPGERTISAPDGTRVAIRQGGTVELWGATTIILNGGSVTIQGLSGADAQVKIAGTLTVTKDIFDQNAARGSLNTLRGDYNGHTHTDTHGDTTGVPTPQTP